MVSGRTPNCQQCNISWSQSNCVLFQFRHSIIYSDNLWNLYESCQLPGNPVKVYQIYFLKKRFLINAIAITGITFKMTKFIVKRCSGMLLYCIISMSIC